MSAITGQRLAVGAGGMVRGDSPTEVLDLAQSADELGFDLFTLSDHLHSEVATYEPWTTLSWLAGRTTRIELGTNVLGLPYRHPAVLAKMAEGLDRVSDGRLVLGLGAGGYDHEFAAYGLPVRTPGAKITAQREAITILRDLWATGESTHDGQEFAVDGARISPVARQTIPIWLGSYGPRALALTGEVADGWVPSLGRLTLEQATAMRETVRAAAAAAGRDPDDVTCATNVTVAADPARAGGHTAITGTPDEIVAGLTRVVAAGFTVLLLGAETVADQELLAREVLPAVRENASALLGP